MTTYVDANLLHDLLTGRSVTGTLHLLNKMHSQWYSKKEGTVETTTYGLEFVATYVATEQIIDLRLTLRYLLVVPLNDKVYIFGVNRSVVTSGSLPQSKLNKRHATLSFHRVREVVASKMLSFIYIPGKATRLTFCPSIGVIIRFG